jgi:hypothetical protein
VLVETGIRLEFGSTKIEHVVTLVMGLVQVARQGEFVCRRLHWCHEKKRADALLLLGRMLGWGEDQIAQGYLGGLASLSLQGQGTPNQSSWMQT